MSFRTQQVEDAAVFTNPDEFGEEVTYTKADGTTRTIDASVDRMPPARIDGAGNVYTPRLTVHVANSSTTGISSSELDAHGADRITVAVRIGETPQSLGCYLAPGTSHDAGMVTIDLK